MKKSVTKMMKLKTFLVFGVLFMMGNMLFSQTNITFPSGEKIKYGFERKVLTKEEANAILVGDGSVELKLYIVVPKAMKDKFVDKIKLGPSQVSYVIPSEHRSFGEVIGSTKNSSTCRFSGTDYWAVTTGSTYLDGTCPKFAYTVGLNASFAFNQSVAVNDILIRASDTVIFAAIKFKLLQAKSFDVNLSNSTAGGTGGRLDGSNGTMIMNLSSDLGLVTNTATGKQDWFQNAASDFTMDYVEFFTGGITIVDGPTISLTTPPACPNDHLTAIANITSASSTISTVQWAYANAGVDANAAVGSDPATTWVNITNGASYNGSQATLSSVASDYTLSLSNATDANWTGKQFRVTASDARGEKTISTPVTAKVNVYPQLYMVITDNASENNPVERTPGTSGAIDTIKISTSTMSVFRLSASNTKTSYEIDWIRPYKNSTVAFSKASVAPYTSYTDFAYSSQRVENVALGVTPVKYTYRITDMNAGCTFISDTVIVVPQFILTAPEVSMSSSACYGMPGIVHGEATQNVGIVPDQWEWVMVNAFITPDATFILGSKIWMPDLILTSPRVKLTQSTYTSVADASKKVTLTPAPGSAGASSVLQGNAGTSQAIQGFFATLAVSSNPIASDNGSSFASANWAKSAYVRYQYKGEWSPWGYSGNFLTTAGAGVGILGRLTFMNPNYPTPIDTTIVTGSPLKFYRVGNGSAITKFGSADTNLYLEKSVDGHSWAVVERLVSTSGGANKAFPNISPVEQAQYRMRMRINSCDTSTQIPILVKILGQLNPGSLTVNPNTNICINTSAVLTAKKHTTGASITWQDSIDGGTWQTFTGTSSTVTDGSDQTSSITYTADATPIIRYFRLKAEKEGQIDYSNEVFIKSITNVAPTITASPDAIATAQCKGTAITLTANGGSYATYEWWASNDDGSGTPTGFLKAANGTPTYIFDGSTSKHFKIKAMNPNCPGQDSPAVFIKIKSATKGTITASPDPLCQGKSATFTYTSSPAPDSYSWKQGTAGVFSSVGTPNSSYTLSAVPVSNSVPIRVIFTQNGCTDSVTAGFATDACIVILPPITGGGSETPAAFCSGNTFDLAFLSATIPVGTIVWQDSISPTEKWADITDISAVTAPYTIPASNVRLTNVGSANKTIYYRAKITDVLDITYSTVISVVVHPLPNKGVIAASFEGCATSDIPLSFSTAPSGQTLTYAWQVAGATTGLTNPSTLTPTYNNATPGTYALTVDITSSQNCVVQASSNVIVNALPASTLSLDKAIVCSGENVVLTATATASGTAPFTFDYMEGTTSLKTITGVALNAAPASFTINNVTASANYTVKVSDAKGCAFTSPMASLTVNPAPSIPVIAANLEVCEGSTLPLTLTTPSSGVGTIVYSWQVSGGGSLSSASDASPIFTATTAGAYKINLEVAIGTCKANALEVDLTVNALPASTLSLDKTTMCSGGDVVLTATATASGTAPFTFDYMGATSLKTITGVALNAAPGSFTINNVTASANYTVKVTDAKGCTFTSAVASLTVNPKPILGSVTIPSNVCTGTEATLQSAIATGGSAPYTYVWKDGSTVINTQANMNTAPVDYKFFPLSNSTPLITLTVTDQNNCSVVSVAQAITVKPAPPKGTLFQDLPKSQSICALSGGSTNFTATAISGTLYSFQWYSGTKASGGTKIGSEQTTRTTTSPNIPIDNSGTTTYFVAIGVSNGCWTYDSAEVKLTVNPLPTTPLVTITPSIVCVGDLVSSISTAAVSGVTYSWTKDGSVMASNTNSILNYAHGASGASTQKYNVTITDANTCSAKSADAILTIKPCIADNATNPIKVCFNTTAPITLTLGDAANTTKIVWQQSASASGPWTNASSPALSCTDNSCLVYTPAVASVAGITYYRAEVTHSDIGVKYSNVVTFTTHPKPTKPTFGSGDLAATASVCEKGSVSFGVTASDATAYAWNKTANTTSNLTISNASAADASVYFVYAINKDAATTCADSTKSTECTLTVDPLPTIAPITISSNVAALCNGGDATVSSNLSANSDYNYTYKWETSSNGTTWATSSITTSTLALTNITALTYVKLTITARDKTSNCVNSLTSNNLTLNPEALPVVSVSITPTTPSVCVNSPITLTASPSTNVGLTFTYDWSEAASSLGANSTLVYTPTTAGSKTIELSIKASNIAGCFITATASTSLTVKALPTVPAAAFTVNPLNLCSGESTVLSGTAAEVGSKMQWLSNGAQVGEVAAPATNFTYSPAIGTFVITLRYELNGCTALHSQSTSLTVANCGSEIVSDINGSTNAINLCSNVTLTTLKVTPSTLISNPPVPTFQWQVGASAGGSFADVSGATSDTYTPDATVGTRFFRAKVSRNDYSDKYSTSISYTVKKAPVKPVFSTQPDFTSVCEGASKEFKVATSAGEGVTYQWYKSPSSSPINTTATYTIAAAVPATHNGTYYALATSNLNGCTDTTYSNTEIFTVYPKAVKPVLQNNLASTYTPCGGTKFAMGVKASAGENLSYQWFKGAAKNLIIGETNDSLKITAITAADNGSYELRIYSTSSNGCKDSISTTTTVTVTLPQIPTSTHPANVVVCENTAASFTITPGNYTTIQWYSGNSGAGTIISGATSATYSISNVTNALNNTSYYAVVSNTANCGTSVTTNAATLTVNPLPLVPTVILNLPVVCSSGGSTTLTASGGSVASANLQWYNGASPIIGATTNNFVYNLPAMSPTTQSITLKLSSNTTPSCSVTTTAEILTINDCSGNKITPKSTVICAQVAAKVLTLSTSEVNPKSIQWEESSDNKVFTSISGAIVNQYTPNVTTFVGQTRYYRAVIVLSSNLQVYSDTASYQVKSLPGVATINSQPTDVSVCENELASFMVNASHASLTPSILWLKGSGQASGTNSLATYTINSAKLTDVDQYKALVITALNGCFDTVVSNPAQLTVNKRMQPIITNQPTGVSICEGAPFTLSVVTSNSTDPSIQEVSYKWFKNNILTDKTTASFTINPSVKADDEGTYYVRIIHKTTNGCTDSINSSNATIVIKAAPASPTYTALVDMDTCNGLPIKLNLNANAASGTAITSYQWFLNNVIIGTTNPLTTRALTTADDNADIYCKMEVRYSDGSCPKEYSSNQVKLRVYGNPSLGSITASQDPVCVNSEVTFTATPSGGSTPYSLVWKANGTVFANPYNPSTSSSPQAITAVLTDNNGCVAPIQNYSLTVSPATIPGTISSGGVSSICVNGTFPTLNLSGNTGSLVKWLVADNPSFTSATDFGTTKPTSTTYSPTGTQLNTSNYIKAVVQNGSSCKADSTATFVLRIDALPIVTTISQDKYTICTASSAQLSLANGYLGTIKWQYSASSNFLSPSDLGASTPTYQLLTNLGAATHYFRAELSNGSCLAQASNVVNVVVTAKAVSPRISATLDGVTVPSAGVCAGSQVKFDFTLPDNTSVLKWQVKHEGETTYTDDFVNTTSSYLASSNTFVIAGKSEIRAVLQTGDCSADTLVYNLVVNAQPLATQIENVKSPICLPSTNVMTIPTGYVGTPVWEYVGINDFTSPATAVNGSISSSYTPKESLDTTYYFRVKFYNSLALGCVTDYSNKVNVVVVAEPIAPTLTADNLIVCEGSVIKITADNYKGSLSWFENDGSGFVGVTGSNTYTRTAESGKSSYAYKVESSITNAGCTQKKTSATINITVNAKPEAISLGKNPANGHVCINETVNLTANTNNGLKFIWQSAADTLVKPYTQMTGTAASIASPALTNTDTLWVRYIAQNGVCSGDTSKWTYIKADPTPVFTNFADLTPNPVCEGQNMSITITYTGGDQLEIYAGNGANPGFWKTINLPSLSGTYTETFAADLNRTYFRPKLINSMVNSSSSCRSSEAPFPERNITVNPITIKGIVRFTPENITQKTATLATSVSLAVTASSTNATTYLLQVCKVAKSTVNNWNFVNVGVYSNSASFNYVVGADTAYFRVLMKSGVCNEEISDTIKLIPEIPNNAIIEPNDPAAFVDGNKICNNLPFVLKLDNIPMGASSFQWQIKAPGASAFTDISGETQNTYSAQLATSGIYTYRVSYEVASVSGYSQEKEIEVLASSSTGTLTATLTEMCVNSGLSSYISAPDKVGRIVKWEFSRPSINGGTWGIKAGTSTGEPIIAGSTLPDSGQYRVVVQNGNCPTATSSPVEIHVYPTSNAGTVIGNDPVCFGATATLTLSLNTGKILNWQDSVSGGANWGTITNTQDLTTITSENANLLRYYRVEVKNGVCPSAFSDPKPINFRDTIVFVTQPISSVGVGNPVSFTSLANRGNILNSTAHISIAYQWQILSSGSSVWTKIAANLLHFSGEKTETLTVMPLYFKENQTDQYRCVATASPCTNDTAISEVVSITVKGALQKGEIFAKLSTNPGGCFFYDSVATYYVKGYSGDSVYFNWFVHDISTGILTSVETTPIFVGHGNAVGTSPQVQRDTVHLQVKDPYMGGGYELVAHVYDRQNTTTPLVNTYALCAKKNPVFTVGTPENDTVCKGVRASFNLEVFADQSISFIYTWSVKKKGDVDFSTLSNTPPYSGTATNNLLISAATIDLDSAVYRVSVLSNAATTPVVTRYALLRVNEPIAITTQPTPLTVSCEGSSVTLNVTATGSAPIKYEWAHKLAGSLSSVGSNANSYTNANLAKSDSGDYVVKVSNACGDLFSDIAVIDVRSKPSITDATFPADVEVCEGSTASFEVKASGDALVYQWKHNDISIAGANASTYSIASVTQANIGSYVCEITSSGSACGSVAPILSRSATLIINAAPIISNQPQDAAQIVTASQIFAVEVSNNLPSTVYQWEIKLDGASDWSTIGYALAAAYNIDDYQKATMNITSVQAILHKAQFRVQISNACGGPVASDAATLIVKMIQDLGHPKDQSVCEDADGEVTFVTKANFNAQFVRWEYSSNGGVTYGQVDDGPIAGESASWSVASDFTSEVYTSTLTITGILPTMSGWLFRCVLDDDPSALPKLTTVPATLLVKWSSTFDKLLATREVIVLGLEGAETSNLSVDNVVGEPPFTYNWEYRKLPLTVYAPYPDGNYEIIQFAPTISDTGIWRFKMTLENACGSKVDSIDIAVYRKLHTDPVTVETVVSDETNQDVVENSEEISKEGGQPVDMEPDQFINVCDSRYLRLYTANESNKGSVKFVEWQKMDVGTTVWTSILASTPAPYILSANGDTLVINPITFELKGTKIRSIAHAYAPEASDTSANIVLMVSKGAQIANFTKLPVDSICVGESLDFRADVTDADTISWMIQYFGVADTTLLQTTQDNLSPVALYSIAAVDMSYHKAMMILKVSNPCGQSFKNIEILIKERKVVSLKIAGDSLYCVGSLAQFTTTASNAGDAPLYRWSVNDTWLVGKNEASLSVEFAAEDIYILKAELTSNLDCVSASIVTDSLKIKVNANPVVVASADDIQIIQGNSTMLRAEISQGVAPYTVLWKPTEKLEKDDEVAVSTVKTLPIGLHMFKVTVADASERGGCVGKDSVEIEVIQNFQLDSIIVGSIIPDPADTTGGKEVNTWTFYGDSIQVNVCDLSLLKIQIKTTGGKAPLAYTFNPAPISPSDYSSEYTQDSVFVFAVKGNMKISFEVKDNGGNTRKGLIDVTARQVPRFVLSKEPKMPLDGYFPQQAVFINAIPKNYSKYDFFRYVDNQLTNKKLNSVGGIFATSFKADETNNHIVCRVTDGTGCVSFDTTTVRLFRVPNAIIPDDPIDGVIFPNFEIEVFNSWGQIVKKMNEGGTGWNGKYRNKEVRAGTYYYRVKIPTLDGFTEIKGSVTVMQNIKK